MIPTLVLVAFFFFLLSLFVQNARTEVFETPFDEVYVLTLKRTEQRVEPLICQLQQLGYPYRIIFGIDGKEITKKDSSIRKQFHNKLKDGEIGCWLSHYKILQDIALLPTNTRILVLEDDVIIEQPIAVPTRDFDVLYLGNADPTWLSFFNCLWSQISKSLGHAGTHAYVITPEGAQKILSHFQNDDNLFALPIDFAYKAIFKKQPDIRVYEVFPEQVFAREEGSVIHDTYREAGL